MKPERVIEILTKAGRSMTTGEIAQEGPADQREAYSCLSMMAARGQLQKGRSGGAKAKPGKKAVKWRLPQECST